MIRNTYTDPITGLTWTMADTIAARRVARERLTAAREAGDTAAAEQAQAQYTYAARIALKCQAQVVADPSGETPHVAHVAADSRTRLRRHNRMVRQAWARRHVNTSQAPREPVSRRARLTPGERDTLRLLIDAVTRERLTPRDRTILTRSIDARAADTIAREMNAAHDAEAWRGVTTVREARHSERGASGIPGVRGVAAQVSSRDAHLPPEMVKHTDTVGHAPHHLLTPAQSDALLLAVRRDRKLTTYRRYTWRHVGWLTVLTDDGVHVAQSRAMRDARDGSRAATPDTTRHASDVAQQALMGADLSLAQA